MNATLVSISVREIGDRRFNHGAELPAGMLQGDLLAYWLDRKWAVEVPERRSLYRLFAPFSGCKEREPLSRNELALFTIGE